MLLCCCCDLGGWRPIRRGLVVSIVCIGRGLLPVVVCGRRRPEEAVQEDVNERCASLSVSRVRGPRFTARVSLQHVAAGGFVARAWASVGFIPSYRDACDLNVSGPRLDLGRTRANRTTARTPRARRRTIAVFPSMVKHGQSARFTRTRHTRRYRTPIEAELCTFYPNGSPSARTSPPRRSSTPLRSTASACSCISRRTMRRSLSPSFGQRFNRTQA